MAIYYIDPHLSTTTATAGTWADPWTFAQTTKSPTLADGDEIRIKGVALSSLLTATSYTATYTSNYQLTITAGGGLGADFAANNIVYFSDKDTFAKVASVSGNVVTIGSVSNTVMPWNDTSTTSLTVRRVDTTTYPVSTAAAINFLVNNLTLNNITISDCWTAASTRVTDGTVKTLINSSAGVANCWFDNQSSTAIGNNNTLNCQNTHIMGGTTNAGLIPYIRSSNSTYNIGQTYCANTTASHSLNFGPSGYPVYNTSVTINHYSGSTLFSASSSSGNNISVTVNNLYSHFMDYVFGSSGTATGFFEDLTVTLGNITANNTSGYLINAFNAKNLTLNLNGTVDLFVSASPSYVYQGYGTAQVNYGGSFAFYRNKRANTTAPTLTNICYINAAINSNTYWIPNISLPSGWTAPTDKWAVLTTSPGTNAPADTYKIANVVNVVLPDSSISSAHPYTVVDVRRNVLTTFRDGSAPFEVLGIGGNKTGTAALRTNAPVTTTDASVYRTSGPSLKTNLTTFVAQYWSLPTSTSIKNIRIPVTNGTSYTVTGYIRTNDTAYVNGDCKVWLVQNGVSLDDQSMTTSCVNAWEQFTLTFTATQTGEVQFAWEMHFSNGGKSYWLDDLTVN